MSKPLPPDWKEVRLSDVAEIQKGTAFTSKELVPGDIPVIAGGREPAYYHKYSNRPPNTITVSASGDAGYVSFHRRPIFATDCTTIRSKPEVSVTNYIHHFLKHNQHQLYRLRTGSALPHLYPRDIARFKIVLPPMQKQISIADTLDSVDEAIEQTENVIAKTEQLRDALLHDLLTRGLPGHHTEWKEVPGIGSIPATWNLARLDEIAKVIFSSVDKKSLENELPVKLCNYTDVYYNRYIHRGMDLMLATATDKECEKWTLRKGDVLFTKDSETPDDIGVPAYVTENLPGILCGYHLGLARPEPNFIQGGFLAEVMGSNIYRKLFSRISNGVTRFGLTLESTKALPVPVPPLSEQNKLSSSSNLIDRTLQIDESIVVKLNSLKDSLSSRLLNG